MSADHETGIALIRDFGRKVLETVRDGRVEAFLEKIPDRQLAREVYEVVGEAVVMSLEPEAWLKGHGAKASEVVALYSLTMSKLTAALNHRPS